MMTELLAHGNDRVVRAMSGALRNLAIDARNRDLLGEVICETELILSKECKNKALLIFNLINIILEDKIV